MRNLLCLLLSFGTLFAGDWPQWRGPKRDGKPDPEETLAPRAIQEPETVWRKNIGSGFSSPIIHGERVFYLDENGEQEVARAADLSSGKELWSVPFAPVFGDEWGSGPRATPFTDGENVYVQSCNGEFRCLDARNGQVRWGVSFERDYGVRFLGSKANEGTASRRGNNGSGLLDGEDVIVPVGSTNGATLVCFNKETGAVNWKSGADEAAYSSLMVSDFAGTRQVVAFLADALCGFERTSGKLLWRVPLRTAAKRHAMTPVIERNRIWVNSHSFGTICYEIMREGTEFKAVQKWKNSQEKINVATPVLIGGHLYTYGPNKNFVCMEAETGRQLWSQPGFGQQYASVLAVGENILTVSDSGEAVLLKASPERFIEVARGQICGKNWNHPALGHGMLLVRDQRSLTCYRARGTKAE